MSEVWPGLEDKDEAWESERIRFPGNGSLQRQVDSYIAHKRPTPLEGEAYREAVKSNDPGLVGSDIFPDIDSHVKEQK